MRGVCKGIKRTRCSEEAPRKLGLEKDWEKEVKNLLKTSLAIINKLATHNMQLKTYWNH